MLKKVIACLLVFCCALGLVACDADSEWYETAMRHIKGIDQSNDEPEDMPVVVVPEKPDEPEKPKTEAVPEPQPVPETKGEIEAWPTSFSVFPPFTGQGDYVLYDLQETKTQRTLYIESEEEPRETVAAYLNALRAAGFVDYGDGCYVFSDDGVTYEFRSAGIWDGSTARLYWFMYSDQALK